MAEDLKRFIFEERANYRRFRSNIDSIITKYDRHFADDAEVDLITLRTYNVRDENVIRKLKPKPFGYTQLLSTKRKELSDSLAYGSCITDDNSSLQNTTIQGSPPNRYSPIFEGNFLRRSSSFYQEPDLVTENDSEFLALKTSYSEIISDKNDEPSDAETLTSHSSDDMEKSLDEDSSEDGDDEDSQGDDNVLPQLQSVFNNDCVAPSSTEERRDAVNQEFVKEKNKQSFFNKPVIDRNKRLEEMQKQIYCLQTELECVKKGDAQIQNSKKIDSSVMFNDEIDGDLPVRYTDKSGYCHRDRLSSRKQQTNPTYKDDKLPQYKNYENIKSWSDQKYLRNKRIEDWVGTINVETGITQTYHDNYLMGCQGGQSSDQTYLVTGKPDMSDSSQQDDYFGYEKGTPVQRVNEKLKSDWGLPNSNLRKDNQQNQPRRIVPALVKTSAGRNESKTVTVAFHNEFSTQQYSVRSTGHNAASTEDGPVGADIDRNDSAKLNCRNVIAKFASPDRLLNKMTEKKVGVAAKMYSEKVKTNNVDEKTEERPVQEGKTLNVLPIESKQVHVKKDQKCSLPSVKSKIQDDNDDIFIVEDDFDCARKPHNSNFSRRPFTGNQRLAINSKVSQSVPALRMQGVEFIDKTNTEHNKNKMLRFDTRSKSEAPILSSKICNRDQREIYSYSNFVKSDSRTKLSSKCKIDDHCKDSTVKTADQSKTIFSTKDTRYRQPKTFLFEKDKNVDSQFSSKSYVPTNQLKKTVKRKFVPLEDTENLIELMLQPETKVATFLTPKAFHKKFEKPIHSDINPVSETLRCLSAAGNTQTLDYESKLSNGNARRNWNNKSVQSEIHENNRRLFSVPTFKRSVISSQKPEIDNDLNTLHNVWDREHMAVEDERKFTMLQCESSSPYRSVKDLPSIELYANSSFHSPDLQKNRQGLMYSQDISKSVPAKLQLKSNIETFSPPPENKLKLFCRTKLKAKRSQQLIGNENVSGVTESNESQFNQDQPFSGKFHTPSKRYPYNYSSVTEESPSTVFSRMLLNTPSPGGRKHTEKFQRCKPRIEPMTQPVDVNCQEIIEGELFKKPFSYIENSRGSNGANGQFYQQSRSNNRYENYVESQNMTSAHMDGCEKDRYYTGNEHFYNTDCQCMDKEYSTNRKEMNFVKANYKRETVSGRESGRFNTEFKYTDKENSKNRKETTLAKVNYKRDTVSGRESGRSNTEFKYTDKENSKNRKETNLVKVNYRQETVSSRESRRKALFQSTPMKSSGMFQLDNTMSTIHGDISDESDWEVMTISDSP